MGSIEMKEGGRLHVHQQAATGTERPDHDRFEFSQDFELWESGDDRAFRLRLETGSRLINHNFFDEGEEFAEESKTTTNESARA
ncbi:hypothetical protein E6H32_02130 [Candidatus Bathyarchaeota archaeon]|nr:MAG: hypothetical protein E6H32_02130 [Candidatus Bathyarchaeota archaeon]